MVTDLVGKLSRFARAREHALDAAIEQRPLGQQADDEEGFAIEVEEKPGVHEHVVVGQELDHQRFLAAIRRHLQDGRPAALDIKERDGPDRQVVPFGGGFGFQGHLAQVYLAMRRCPQPIVSLVQGPACGGGFAFVLASDIRIAGESARMNAAFIRIGLSACDMGVSYFLPRLVGTSVASELMLTGRFIHAQRALATGLVSEVVPDDQLEAAAQPYVDEMLATSPMGLRLTKEGLSLAVDAPGLEAAMAIENRNQTLCARTDDFAEGRRAFLEKRKPVYTDS